MKRHTPILVLGFCAIGFVVGVIQLFHLRFERGDVYPPYSSLRADPLGTMALYESLQRVPGIEVRRDFSARNTLPDSRDTTYLHLSGDPADWRWVPDALVGEIENFMARGGRLVIACEPDTRGFGSSFEAARPRDSDAADSRKRDGEPLKPAERSKRSDEADRREELDLDPEVKWTNVRERWGFEVESVKLPRGIADSSQPVTVTNRSSLPLPPAVEWHSATVFTGLAAHWQVLYARGTNAVVMERRFGRGSMVFAGDSFFVSNEALSRDRHADLLVWLVGDNRTVVFDEAHLGVVEEPGVATLMRRYRLHGVIAGLALLMGLFVWKNAFSLVPPPARASGQSYVAGRDAAAGFVNLLRRSVPPGEILKVCFDQWEKSAAGRRELSPSRIERARQAVADELARPALDRNPVRTYREVSQLMKCRSGSDSAAVLTSESKS